MSKSSSSSTSSQFSASHCSEHTYSDHSWRCLPQMGTKRRGEGILRMEDAGTSEENDIDSQDSNTAIDHGHLARNCLIKITTPAVKASVIYLKLFRGASPMSCLIFARSYWITLYIFLSFQPSQTTVKRMTLISLTPCTTYKNIQLFYCQKTNLKKYIFFALTSHRCAIDWRRGVYLWGKGW